MSGPPESSPLVFSIALFAGSWRVTQYFRRRYYDNALRWMQLAHAKQFHLVIYVDRLVQHYADGHSYWRQCVDSEWVTVRRLRGVRGVLNSAFYKYHQARGHRWDDAGVYAKMGLRWQVLDDYPNAFVCVRDADSPISPFDLAMQRRVHLDSKVKHFAYTWECDHLPSDDLPFNAGTVTGGGTSMRTGKASRGIVARYHAYLAHTKADRKTTRSTDELFLRDTLGCPDHGVATRFDVESNTYKLKGTTAVVIPSPYGPLYAGRRVSTRLNMLKASRIPLEIFT